MKLTTYGSIRGSCGHTHRKEKSASLCLTKDNKSCEKYGGYTDRSVHTTDCRLVLTVGSENCSCRYLDDIE